MFDYIGGDGGDFAEVRGRALKHRSVGEWMSFKCVDLVDGCLRRPVDQSDVRPFLYRAPREALLAMHAVRCGAVEAGEDAVLLAELDYLRRELRGLEVPHKPGLPLDMFCLETVACKFASHLGGQYPLMKDTLEVGHGLAGWGASAEQFRGALPRQIPPVAPPTNVVG